MNFQQLIDYFRPTHVRQVKSGTFLRTRVKRRFKKTIVEHGVTIPFSKRNPAIQSNISNEIAHTEPKSIGSKAALAENWLAGNLEIPPIGYELLKDAKVFGGRITERGPGWHKSGQLVLTRKNEIVHSALGLMDGHPTYPANLCHPVKNGYQMSNTHHLKYLPGVYYLVGNVHYHFGHVVLEGLTRLWAMSFFPQYQKQLWYIVYESEIDGYAQDLLSLVGVSKDKIIFMTEPIVVETLIVPDAAMCTHSWLSTLQIGVWDKIRMSVKSGDANRKVFFSRRNVSDRPVSNQDDVEDHFRSLGYEIVSPERLSVYEQVKLAAESQSIAGFVGSQMFLCAFQSRGARNFIIAPRNFFLQDDVLIAECTGKTLQVIFGTSIDFTVPKNQSVWSVDIERLREATKSLETESRNEVQHFAVANER